MCALEQEVASGKYTFGYEAKGSETLMALCIMSFFIYSIANLPLVIIDLTTPICFWQ